MECWNCGKQKPWLKKECPRCGADDETLKPALLFWGAVAFIVCGFVLLAAW